MPCPEDRAASEIIGAVILFGFLVVAFTIYQGVVVPQQNRAVEFDHNEAVQDSFQDLRNAIRQTASTGAEQAVSIKLGPSYPQRILAINPGAPAGSIQTEPLGTIQLRNVTATDAETKDYFGTTTTKLGPFESKAVVYRPIYFQYTVAPVTRYENSLAYNRFPSGANLSITDQALVDGRKITLIALEGNVSTARQGAVSIDTQSVSTASNTVSVNSSGGPINITITTRLTAQNWTDLLEDELDTADPDDRFVTDVRQTGPNQVSIILEEGVTYELRLAKVGVGTGSPSEPAKYIVDVEGDDTSVVEDGTRKLVVEVRDRFNNPVSNVTVTANIEQFANATEDSVSPTKATTGADGRATFTYVAPQDVDDAKQANVSASFSGDGTRNETVHFDVRVLDADGSGGDGDSDGVSQVNPSGENKLVLVNSSEASPKNVARLKFNNTADSDITAVKIRVPFYFADSQNAADVVEEFAGTTSFGGAANLSIGAPLAELDTSVTFAPGPTTETIVFDGDNVQTRGDFFILVLELDNGATVTYFVAPQ